MPPKGPPMPAPLFQQWPSLALGGGVALVAWMDNRDGGGGNDIYAARLSPAGEVLDRGGIAVSRAAGAQEFADLAFDGTSFLLVWEDGRGPGIDLYGARLSPTGSVLDKDGIVIARAPGKQAAPAVAAAPGGGFFVVWQDGRDSTADGAQNDIYGARVAADGKVLDPDGLAISRGPGRQAAPALAAVPGGYFVAWQDLRKGEADIYGARLDADGKVRDPDGLVLSAASGTQAFPALALGKDQMLVAWSDGRRETMDIYAARVGLDGRVRGSELRVTRAGGDQQFPTVLWDGARYWLLWQDERGEAADVYAARVSAAGQLLDPAGLPVQSSGTMKVFPRAVLDGNRVLAVWEDFRNQTADIYGARLDLDGFLLDREALLISSAP